MRDSTAAGETAGPSSETAGSPAPPAGGQVRGSPAAGETTGLISETAGTPAPPAGGQVRDDTTAGADTGWVRGTSCVTFAGMVWSVLERLFFTGLWSSSVSSLGGAGRED